MLNNTLCYVTVSGLHIVRGVIVFNNALCCVTVLRLHIIEDVIVFNSALCCVTVSGLHFIERGLGGGTAFSPFSQNGHPPAHPSLTWHCPLLLSLPSQ